MNRDEENSNRLKRARMLIANNPENLLIEAAAAGDSATVKRLLEHVLDLPRSRVFDDKFILLRDSAYDSAFAAAADNFHFDCVKTILDYAGHKVNSFGNVAKALYKAATTDPDIQPNAEDIMNIILDRKSDILPNELKETATRLRNAYQEDIERAEHIRNNFSQFLAFYVVKEETTKRAKDKKSSPSKLHKIFADSDKNNKDNKNKTKKRPDYLKPV